jgi:ABC-2 type transport system ATP-binding protein
LASSTIEIEFAQPLPNGHVPDWPDAERVLLDEQRGRIAVISRRPARAVVEMVRWLDETGIELADIRIKRPSLEDAFIALTGKSLRE